MGADFRWRSLGILISMDIVYKRKPFYYETDKMGIVHHSNYIRWFEEARIYFMEQMGYPYDRLETEGIIIPVVSVSCNYKRMVHFGDELDIVVRISKYNSAVLECEYEVKDSLTQELCTTGKSSHCFLDTEGKLTRLKRTNPEAHEAFQRLAPQKNN